MLLQSENKILSFKIYVENLIYLTFETEKIIQFDLTENKNNSNIQHMFLILH